FLGAPTAPVCADVGRSGLPGARATHRSADLPADACALASAEHALPNAVFGRRTSTCARTRCGRAGCRDRLLHAPGAPPGARPSRRRADNPSPPAARKWKIRVLRAVLEAACDSRGFGTLPTRARLALANALACAPARSARAALAPYCLAPGARA